MVVKMHRFSQDTGCMSRSDPGVWAICNAYKVRELVMALSHPCAASDSPFWQSIYLTCQWTMHIRSHCRTVRHSADGGCYTLKYDLDSGQRGRSIVPSRIGVHGESGKARYWV